MLDDEKYELLGRFVYGRLRANIVSSMMGSASWTAQTMEAILLEMERLWPKPIGVTLEQEMADWILSFQFGGKIEASNRPFIERVREKYGKYGKR